MNAFFGEEYRELRFFRCCAKIASEERSVKDESVRGETLRSSCLGDIR